MSDDSKFLASLSKDERAALERRLLDRQSGRCFICDDRIDLFLHQGDLDIDHIIPLDDKGPDEENNFALTHLSCNRSKGSSDLRVARRMAEFERLQRVAQTKGARGATLGHVLERYGGAKAQLTLKRGNNHVEFVLREIGDNSIHSAPLQSSELQPPKTHQTVHPRTPTETVAWAPSPSQSFINLDKHMLC